MNSNSKSSNKGEKFRSESNKKCKNKRKSSVKDSSRMHQSKTKRKSQANIGRSRERNFESRIDFYQNKTSDSYNKENLNYNRNHMISEREQNRTIKMFRMNSDDYEEGNSSSTPEASSEHKAADINIEGHMDQRVMNPNKM